MKRSVSFRLILLALSVAALGTLPRGAVAHPRRTPPPIALTYRSGPVLAKVRVVTLFWGSNWSGSQLSGHLNNFLSALFADGRYMANLAQYGVSGFPIGNGTLDSTATDSRQPPARLQDAAIQTEIRAQIAAGHLPTPDENTVYAVFTPPNVEVFDAYGGNSVGYGPNDFVSYHDWASGNDGFPYLVMTYDDSLGTAQDSMTVDLSHELAEVVTDPDPNDLISEIGWYDDYYGEVADIVDTLYNERLIGDADYVAQLKGPDGSSYLVEKFWSVKANAPVAF
jgi:hypothetical protein